MNKYINYVEYIAENLDKNINYAEYIADNLDKNINYAEYLADNLDNSFEDKATRVRKMRNKKLKRIFKDEK